MIKLISLSFNGIGRFVEKQHIDFSNKDKLLQIDGKNENTGGSSGAGKSTIFHALDYLLGIGDIPATTLQSRLTKSAISVEADLEIDGKKVTISRSKKDGLTLVIDSETVSGNVKAAEERLEALIGIPKKIFKKMVHKKQKEGGFFLNLTAKESYEFLTKALGLDDLTSRIALIEQDIKKSKENLIGYEKHRSILESEIETSKLDVSSFSLASDKPSQVYIEECQWKLDNFDRNIVALQIELETAQESLEKEKPAKRTVDTAALSALLQKLESDKSALEDGKSKELTTTRLISDSLRHDIKRTEASLNRIPFIKQQISKMVEEMKSYMEHRTHIEKSECPTCRQLWVGNSAQNELQIIQSRIEKIKSDILELKYQADLEPELSYNLNRQNTEFAQLELKIKDIELSYSTKISDVATELSNTKNTILNMQNQIDSEYSQQLNQFKLDSMAKTQRITSLMLEEKTARSSIVNELDSLKRQVQLYEKSLQMKNMLESKMDKQINDLQVVKQDTEKIQRNILIAEESKRLIKSYSLQKFQETLDSIGETASDILRNVPNMSTASIYFEGCKETNSGSIKEEVTAFINMDGESDVDIKSLSGGERTAIDLAVDLAVIDVLEVKAGKGADFFILDEPFDGLDSVGRAAVVDIIKGIDSGKRIVIVDHGAETKEIISDKIIAVRSGETSYVV